jgi:hypothetical protein
MFVRFFTTMQLQRYSFFLISLMVLVSFLTSCSEAEKGFQAPLSPISIERFEQDLFNSDTTDIIGQMQQWDAKYPNFLKVYFEGIMKFGKLDDPALLDIVADYSSNIYMKELKEDCDSVFGDFEKEKKYLEMAMGNYKHHFPSKPTPRFITYVSGFNNQIILGDSLVGIGLDMFLGPTYEYYFTTNIPRYIIQKFDRKYLPVNTIKGILQGDFPAPSEDNFTHKLIIEGKHMVALDYLFPNTADSIKIGFTESQMAYCDQNEGEIWAFFIERDLLYSNRNADIARYFNDAPYTVTLSPKSAPKLGVFAGWKIVRKYMDKNPDLTLKELMEETDYQKIMQGAAYKPKI